MTGVRHATRTLDFTLECVPMMGLTISRSAALGMAVEPFAEVTAAGAVHEHFTIFVNTHPLTPPVKEKEMTALHPDAQETVKLVAFLTPPCFVTEERAPVDSNISPASSSQASRDSKEAPSFGKGPSSTSSFSRGLPPCHSALFSAFASAVRLLRRIAFLNFPVIS